VNGGLRLPRIWTVVGAIGAFVTRRGWLLITRMPPTPVEVLIAGVALIWAGVLLLPGATFTTATSYRALALLLPEPGWAVATLCLGSGQAWAVLADAWRGRRRGAALGWAWWAFAGGAFILANPATISGWIYIWLAAWELWAYVRLGGLRAPHG
jgi:hypothetical protein